jgi:predicted dienelactone hydrolase
LIAAVIKPAPSLLVYASMQKIWMTAFWLLMITLANAQSFTTDTSSVYDPVRQRSIPYKVYMPQPMNGSYPVIIFSHGLGGSRNAAPYLGEYLAAHGYVCFHIQHAGSDESIWRGMPLSQIKSSLKSSLKNTDNVRNRMEDVPFMLQAIASLNANDNRFKGHLNMEAIGMAGHSYGAVSTMVACGQKLGGTITRFAVPEIKAGVVLSPSLPENVRGDLADYYENIQVPLFHITGTQDDNPISGQKDFDPADRQVPYKTISTSPQYLLVLDGATHASFGGNEGNRRTGANSKRYTDAVSAGALAFFDSYLKKSKAQEDWLKKDFGKTLLQSDTFEYKQ